MIFYCLCTFCNKASFVLDILKPLFVIEPKTKHAKHADDNNFAENSKVQQKHNYTRGRSVSPPKQRQNETGSSSSNETERFVQLSNDIGQSSKRHLTNTNNKHYVRKSFSSEHLPNTEKLLRPNFFSSGSSASSGEYKND